MRRLLGPAIAVVVVALIEVLSWTPLKFAASAPILILAVVCATFVGGLVDGLIAAGIVVWYYAYDLSSTGMAFPYTHETLRRVFVFACSAPAVSLMVGLLKQRAARIAAEAARKERESADAVYTSLTWTREAERFGREAERRRVAGRGTRPRHGAADRPAPRRPHLVRGQPRRRGILFHPGGVRGVPRCICGMR